MASRLFSSRRFLLWFLRFALFLERSETELDLTVLLMALLFPPLDFRLPGTLCPVVQPCLVPVRSTKLNSFNTVHLRIRHRSHPFQIGLHHFGFLRLKRLLVLCLLDDGTTLFAHWILLVFDLEKSISVSVKCRYFLHLFIKKARKRYLFLSRERT